MLVSAYDRSGGKPWDGGDGPFLPEVDPTDLVPELPKFADPERRLLFAVLADAIVKVQQLAKARGSAYRELMEAERWIRSDDRTWPCSFVNVCEALDVAYQPLRRAVLALRKRAGARVSRRKLEARNPPRKRRTMGEAIG